MIQVRDLLEFNSYNQNLDLSEAMNASKNHSDILVVEVEHAVWVFFFL